MRSGVARAAADSDTRGADVETREPSTGRAGHGSVAASRVCSVPTGAASGRSPSSQTQALNVNDNVLCSVYSQQRSTSSSASSYTVCV